MGVCDIGYRGQLTSCPSNVWEVAIKMGRLTSPSVPGLGEGPPHL